MQSLEIIREKLEVTKSKMVSMLKEQPFLLQRLPKSQELFIKKLFTHFPQYLNQLVDNEIKEELVKQTNEVLEKEFVLKQQYNDLKMVTELEFQTIAKKNLECHLDIV